MRKSYVKASTTIEMAYIMPIAFLVFITAVYISFYMHDKNIIKGAAYETAVIGARQERLGKETADQIPEYFQERVKGKLIFFSYAEAEGAVEDKAVLVTAKASAKGMRIKVEERASVINPEEYIRDIRKAEKAAEVLFK